MLFSLLSFKEKDCVLGGMLLWSFDFSLNSPLNNKTQNNLTTLCDGNWIAKIAEISVHFNFYTLNKYINMI